MPAGRPLLLGWVVVGGLALALLAILYAAPILDERPLNIAYEAVTIPAILGSGLLALWRSRKETVRSHRVAWALIGFGGLAWGLGEIGWTYRAVVLDQDVPTPTWIDVPYLLNIPLMAAGALALAWQRDGHRFGALRLLDSLLVAGTIFLAVWVAVLRDLVTDSGLASASAVVAILYPVGDVVVLVALSLACMRLERAALRALVPLFAGMAVIAFGDLGFSWVYLRTGGYGTTGFDLAWTAGAVLNGWAALRPTPQAAAHRRPSGRLEQWLPTLLLALLIPLLVIDLLPDLRIDLVTVAVAVTVGFLLLGRQALMLDVHLRISRSLLETQSAAGLGSWTWDAGRRLVRLSDSALPLLGLEGTTDVAFGDLLLRVHPDDRPGLEADWAGLTGSGRPFERVVRIPAPADRHIRFSGQASSPLRGTLLDVTRDVQLHQQAREAQALKAEAERLAEVNRLKAQFINMAAHELNTPLTPITVSLATLKRGDKAKKPQAETLALLERNVYRLVHLLRDVLDSARLQSDRMRFDLRVLDLSVLTQDIVEEQRLVAEERGIELSVDAQPALVRADPARLGEIVTNLLTNAVKFTPGGKVHVEVHPGDGLAHLSVRDNGRGIDAQDLPKLFQPFSQVGPAVEGPPIGTGLGLYIVHGIVERLGGRIWAESEGLGKGTVFRLELPLVDAAEAAEDGLGAR